MVQRVHVSSHRGLRNGAALGGCAGIKETILFPYKVYGMRGIFNKQSNKSRIQWKEIITCLWSLIMIIKEIFAH